MGEHEDGKRQEAYRDHVGGDVADAASPALRGTVENVVHADALVLLHDGVEVLLEQDVLGGDVGKDEVDLGLVAQLAAAHNGADDLQHRRDAGAAGNHAKVADHVGRVDKRALGAPDADGLADGQRGQVPADVALRVRLDEQVKVARLVVAADGRVGAHDRRDLVVGVGQVRADGDVLANGQAENAGRARKLEAVAVGSTCQQGGPLHQGGGGDQLQNTHMATLCEMIVFSLSSNSWNLVGSRTFLGTGFGLLGSLSRQGRSRLHSPQGVQHTHCEKLSSA